MIHVADSSWFCGMTNCCTNVANSKVNAPNFIAKAMKLGKSTINSTATLLPMKVNYKYLIENSIKQVLKLPFLTI